VPHSCVNRLAGAWLALLALLLGGCAQLPAPREDSAFEFEIQGRVAMRYRDEAASGNISWRHGRLDDDLLITSALGQGIARIVREAERVRLTTREGREYTAADAEALTEQVLGFRLPLAGLADWILGRPAPGASQARRDIAGRLEALEQDGWKIDYEAWSEDGARPIRMTLTYPGMQLRLAISDWRLPR